MHRTSFGKTGVFLLILSGLVVSVCGCQKIKGLFVKPPPEDFVQESRTITMWGYSQSAVVNADREELFDYISEISASGIKGVSMGGGGSAVQAGSHFPFSFKAGGLDIEGRMIVIKSDEENYWMVWHNPRMFHVQRWRYEKVKGGMKMSLQSETQVMEAMEKIPGFERITEELLKDIDMYFARIQAHFDPSLTAGELVEKGLRGESYEKLIQVHEGRVWIDAMPAEVDEYIEEHPEEYMPQYEPKGECPSEEETSEYVIYCPYLADFGALKFDLHTFTINDPRPYKPSRMYWTAEGVVGWLEWEIKATRGGTEYSSTIAFVVPGSMSSGGAESLMALARVPRNMKESLMKVKNGVEKQDKI